jgi:hypothetical protein
MSEARPRRLRGFATLDPERRKRLAALGGHARRASGAAYSINGNNARAMAELRWKELVELSSDTRSTLARLVSRSTMTDVARTAGIARSTLKDALRGARVTRATESHIAQAIERLTKEEP